MTMADVNLSLVLHKKCDLRLEDRPIPEPGPGCVQISMRDVGICGSDISYWQKGGIGDFIVQSPMVMGHEPSGVVSKLGPGVTSLCVGDRVAIEPGIPCRVCRYCKGGRYNLCREMKFCATPPTDGCLARYFTTPEDLCFKLPDSVSFEEGALLQPLAIAVHACNRANISLGQNVLICGAGPMGVFNLLTARARGAAKICITDIDQSRLDFAHNLGATHTVLVTGEDHHATAKKVEEALGDLADVTIECSGAPSSIRSAVCVTQSGGRVVLVGLGHANVELPIVSAATREVDLIGMFRFVYDYPTALAMVTSGQIDLKQLVTHRFKLEESLEAFEAAKRGEGVKIVISCGRN